MEQWVYDYFDEVDRNTCVLCFNPANHPHHIILKSAGGSDERDNLAPLCGSCHTRVHESGAKNYQDRIREAARLIREFYQRDEE